MPVAASDSAVIRPSHGVSQLSSSHSIPPTESATRGSGFPLAATGLPNRSEISRLFAGAYLRLLRARLANQREQAQLRRTDSSELSCYEMAVE